MVSFGSLYIVATPIGNLQDMTLRAVEILKTVDYIAAEDTRHSLPLLRHYGIQASLLALHEHNERDCALKLFDLLKQGKSIALISDAGTPLINDPGYFLVREAHELGIKVVPLPGACAAIAALSASGLPTDKFSFEGFLPAKSTQRLQQLQNLSKEPRTMIFYEAPHRILESLQDMQTVFGVEREVVLARELTKTFETIRAGKLAEIIAWVTQDTNQQRGEIVLIVKGAEQEIEQSDTDSLLQILLAELPLKQAVDLAAKISGARKNELYQRALVLKKI